MQLKKKHRTTTLMAVVLLWLKEAIPTQTISPSILITTTFVVLSLFYLLRNGARKKPNLPPGPSKLPLIGNLHQLGDMPHLSLGRLSEKFGPIIHLQLGQIPTVVVSSARLAKEVTKNHDLALSSRPRLYSAKHLFYNCTDVAFSPYGPYWRHIRKICILELLSVKRVQSYEFIRDEESRVMIARVAKECPGNVDLSKILGLYASDVLCRAAFGRSFSTGGEYDKHDFQKMLEEYQILLGGFSMGEYFPSMEWISTLTGMKSRLVNTFRRFDQFFDEIIEEHRDPSRVKEDNKDLVDVLLNLKENEEALDMPLTMDNVKAVILDMFAAGTDTTFITLDWGMTELLMNPKVLEKVQTEVRTVVGERNVLENDLPKLPYMKAVVKEIFRLHPAAPVLVPRESMEDVTIDGYNIPAKTRFFVNAWAIGRAQESWGENPEVFNPDRFVGSSVDYKGQDFELIPFGAGRRICPAIAFGTASVELALARLLHDFDWELPPGVEAKDLDMTEAFGITMHRTEHLIVVAKPHYPKK